MATLNVIRRWALREQMSIREISRRKGLARNTVKKYLRSNEVEPKLPKAEQFQQTQSLCRKAGFLATNKGSRISEIASQIEADLRRHDDKLKKNLTKY